MTWKISFENTARKEFKKLDPYTKTIIKDYIDSRLLNDPLKYGKPLTGNKKGLRRYRIGDYRVIAKIINQELVILVVAVAHRSVVYK